MPTHDARYKGYLWNIVGFICNLFIYQILKVVSEISKSIFPKGFEALLMRVHPVPIIVDASIFSSHRQLQLNTDQNA